MNRTPDNRNVHDAHQSIYSEVERKEKMRNRFFRDLISWAGTSFVIMAMDVFLSGGITWSKFPVFFYSMFMAMRLFRYVRARNFGGEYPGRSRRRTRRRNHGSDEDDQFVEDYSDELLHQEERDLADLKEYRQAGKPWKDEDLV